MRESLLAKIESTQDIYDLLFDIGNWFYAFLLALAVIAILWGAFTYITAGGDTEKITRGKLIVVYAIVGAAVATLSRSVIAILQSIFA